MSTIVAPAAMDSCTYAIEAGRVLCSEPSEKESGVTFNVAITLVCTIPFIFFRDEISDAYVQCVRVEGTGSILGYGQSQEDDWMGKRGKGITLFIGIADGSTTSVKSDLTLFCKIGWMKSGIMLF